MANDLFFGLGVAETVRLADEPEAGFEEGEKVGGIGKDTIEVLAQSLEPIEQSCEKGQMGSRSGRLP